MSPMILEMKTSREGVIPNDFTFSMILSAHPLVSPFHVHAKLIKTNHKDSASAVEGVIPNDFTFSMILSVHPLVSPFQVHAKLIKTNHKDSASAVSLSDDIFIDNKIKYVQL
ncbi:hypothetical protein V2J09_002825 [Rumex salicifolius]